MVDGSREDEELEGPWLLHGIAVDHYMAHHIAVKLPFDSHLPCYRFARCVEDNPLHAHFAASLFLFLPASLHIHILVLLRSGRGRPRCGCR